MNAWCTELHYSESWKTHGACGSFSAAFKVYGYISRYENNAPESLNCWQARCSVSQQGSQVDFNLFLKSTVRLTMLQERNANVKIFYLYAHVTRVTIFEFWTVVRTKQDIG